MGKGKKSLLLSFVSPKKKRNLQGFKATDFFTHLIYNN